MLIIEVLTYHAGVGEAQVAVFERWNTSQWIEIAVPLRVTERKDDFQLVIQRFFREEQTNFTDERRQRCAVDSQAHA